MNKIFTKLRFIFTIGLVSFLFSTDYTFAQNPGNALDFDGINDYVSIPDNSSLQLSSGISIEAWIYFSSAFSSYSSEHDLGLVNKGNYSLGMDFQSGKLVFELDDTSPTSWTKSYEGSNELIKSLIVYNGKLYAGLGNDTGDGDILVYDGSSWSTSYDGSQESIESFAVYNGKLYAGQSRTTGDGDILVFDGSTWSISYNGTEEAIKSLAVYNGKLYAGQGNGPGNGDIFVFDGSTWGLSYDGAEKRITALAVYNGKLYAGQGNNLGTGDVLVFDGSTWSISYDGSQEIIKALCVFNGKLYAGQGSSTGDGDILVFNDTTWSLNYNGSQETIETFEVYNGKLYAGQGSGTGDGDILVLDDNTWNLSYNGTEEQILDLSEFNGKLYSSQGNNTLDGDVYVYGNSVVLESNKTSWATDSWYHVAGTFDGSNMKIFVDGKEDASQTISFTIDIDSIPLWIGYDGRNSYFYSAIDEIRIWNDLRTQQEIRENMHRIVTPASESNLVAYWQLNESSGTSAADSKGSNTGTLTNMTDADWVASTAPFGGGLANSTTGFTSGTANLGTFSLTTTDAFDNAVDITSTEILNAPNVLPSIANPLNDRYWAVDVFGTPGTYTLNVTLTLPAGYLTLGDEANLNLYNRSSNSDGSWSLLISGATSMTSTTVTFNGVSTLGQFTIGSSSSPLPVELVSFSAGVSNNRVILTWSTATEVNNYGFEIQRSNKTDKWNLLGFVEGHGNSNSLKEYSFTDSEINTAGIYYYRLKQIDNDGAYEYSNQIEVNFKVPGNFELSQNYPNPFNPSTTISFNLPKSGLVTLRIYNLMGEEIKTLVEGYKETGIYTVNFTAEDLASGMYLYRLNTNDFTETKKMLLMK